MIAPLQRIEKQVDSTPKPTTAKNRQAVFQPQRQGRTATARRTTRSAVPDSSNDSRASRRPPGVEIAKYSKYENKLCRICGPCQTQEGSDG